MQENDSYKSRNYLATVKKKRVFQEKRYQSSRYSQKKRESSGEIQKSVGDFLKTLGDFFENVGDFSKNVGDNFRNVGVFYLTAWRSPKRRKEE